MTRPVSVFSRAPLRADLAGGTLDLWPLGCFHAGSRTVNVALDGFAECRLVGSSNRGWRFESEDYGSCLEFETLDKAALDDRTALLANLAIHFGIPSGLTIRTRSDCPPGSGLGGSSALGVAAAGAMAEWSGTPLPPPERLVALLRDLEASHLGKPAGIQDFYPPILGGALTIHHRPGGEVVERPVSEISSLAERLLFFHTGRSHFSAENNWEIFRRRCEGDRRITGLFDEIGKAAEGVDLALRASDWNRFASCIDAEWNARQQLAEGVVTVEMAEVERRARSEGAAAVKTCGAGGGGVLLIVVNPERRESVRSALDGLIPSGGWLDFRPEGTGLRVQRL